MTGTQPPCPLSQSARNGWGRQAECRLLTLTGPRSITFGFAHEAAIADHVGCEDSGKPAVDLLGHGCTRLKGLSLRLGYEAGYDGFWLASFLEQRGIECLVMEPASLQIEAGRAVLFRPVQQELGVDFGCCHGKSFHGALPSA